MDLTPRADDLLTHSLARFAASAGDRRTGRLLAATGRGSGGGERPVGARIAAFAPGAGRGPA